MCCEATLLKAAAVIAQQDDPAPDEASQSLAPPKAKAPPAQKPLAQSRSAAAGNTESELSDIADFSDEDEQSKGATSQAGPRKRRKPNESEETQSEVRTRKVCRNLHFTSSSH